MTTISAKIANEDKISFERICDSMGINISSAINSFVKATIRENGLPFALKASEDPYIYSEENMKYLRKSIEQIETGKCQIHELKESDR
ncbi:type II toxin-antitoxin system RelB/DinJ family antitoxin [Treponema vincentii]|uniref:type II toxin-antitoxin system RelB/DinJ family antitoxin n=1 Tax=Treponema vincentii TaxID=69710 RepID=UPI003D92F84E